MVNKKHKKVSIALNYTEQSLIVLNVITNCVSTSVFASLPGILVGVAKSEVGFKICAITAGIKKYKPTIKKKREKAWYFSIIRKN